MAGQKKEKPIEEAPVKKPVEEAPVEEVTGKLNLTPDEQALAARMSDSDRSWETIKEEDMEDFSLAEAPYKLPKEAKDRQDKHEFAFRWVEAKTWRVDEVRNLDPPAKWWVCNATNTPFLSKYVDPAHGGVQHMDQVLMFKPWFMHAKHQGLKADLGRAKDVTVDKRHGQKEEWGEWKAGEEVRVKGGDQVFNPDSGEFVTVDE